MRDYANGYTVPQAFGVFLETFWIIFEPLGWELNPSLDLHPFALLCTLKNTQASSIYNNRKTRLAYGVTKHSISFYVPVDTFKRGREFTNCLRGHLSRRTQGYFHRSVL